MRPPPARAALAGVVAAAAWAAAEPVAQRVFRTPYSDVRALGAPFSQRHWRAVGTAIHLANGAAAGVAFHRLGLRGWKTGVLVFQVETLLGWPLMTIVDRWHPDRRSGAWPPLLGNGRVFAQEAAVHTLFGAILGALVRAPTAPDRPLDAAGPHYRGLLAAWARDTA
jgi:hypothetical protein